MLTPEQKGHLVDFGKGLISALLTAIGLAFMQYMGAHVPQLLQLLTMTATSTATIITTK